MKTIELTDQELDRLRTVMACLQEQLNWHEHDRFMIGEVFFKKNRFDPDVLQKIYIKLF
jgi:hypothetical protein